VPPSPPLFVQLLLFDGSASQVIAEFGCELEALVALEMLCSPPDGESFMPR